MKEQSVYRKVIASFFVFCFFFLECLSLFSTPAHALDTSAFPSTSGAGSVYLYNFESDQILLKKSNLSKIAPASTVKMMTGLVALTLLDGRWNESVTITDEMLADVEGYTVHLEKGMTVRIKDLLYGTICGGGNDAATALAVVCSGTVKNFVSEMNRCAQEWGCPDTHYTNPTGIDDSMMYTTLDDTMVLAKKALGHPLFLEISSATNYTYTPQGFSEESIFYNRNALISSFSAIGYQNKYVQGLNAGMTERGGYCVVTYATDGNASYLCIVMGASQTENGIMSYKIANALLNHVLKKYSYLPIAPKGTEICTTPVRLAVPQNSEASADISCVLAQDLYGYLPADVNPSENLTYRYYLHHTELTAPVASETVVGGVDVYLGDEWIASAKLVTAEEMPASGLLTTLDRMKSVFLSRTFLISLILFIILLILYLYRSFVRYKRKNSKEILYRQFPKK